MTNEPAVRAVNFESREVYRSAQRPGYTSWVSFFPGERGQWYLTCEEVTRPEKPLPQCSRQHWYEMGLPSGYDKSQYLKETVILESTDDMDTWQVISRRSNVCHHTAGAFAWARTKDGRFLNFAWNRYSEDPAIRGYSGLLLTSDDDGKSWQKLTGWHDGHFAGYPHRLRTLRDGTLVLAVPLRPAWGAGTDHPIRTSTNLNAVAEMQMTLFFSYDQGRTWDGPLPIYPGQTVSETDFVELPEGHLLCINNSIFKNPGRQFVYRRGRMWTPGPLERAPHAWDQSRPLPPGKRRHDLSCVPETVCLTEDGVLVGCLRNSNYQWSDDLGLTWQPLEGAPDLSPEMYQPWIQYLGDGRVMCAGHYGHDDAIGKTDQYLMLHSFRLEVLRRTRATEITIERDFDDVRQLYPNAYTLTLTAGSEPLAGKEVEFWYVKRDTPGYEQWVTTPLGRRMEMGGTLIRARTGADGEAHVRLPELDQVEEVHVSYQLVARFNNDRSDPDYKPAQTAQLEQYCVCRQDPEIKEWG